jgi:hypothetical protein
MGASQSQPPYTPAPIHYQTGQECAYPSGISVVGSYPQRPGEADCSFFLKTGECSFGPTCRFNHPPNRVPSVVSRPSSIAAAASVKLTLAGLPRREVKHIIHLLFGN